MKTVGVMFCKIHYNPIKYKTPFFIWMILTSVVLGTLPGRLHAMDYFISSNGSDNNYGTNQQNPWGTFQHANQVLTSGNTLILLDGTYNQQLHQEISGTAELPITYRAKNRWKAVIQMQHDGNAILLLPQNSVGFALLQVPGE